MTEESAPCDGPQDTEADDGTRQLANPVAAGLAAAPLGHGDTLGRYVIIDELGAGGMGVVYRAYDPELDRRVALKVLRVDGGTGTAAEAARARLLREAQAVARLAHPNVVSVFDAGRAGERVFIAMEYVLGGTLRQWLRERPRSWREVLGVFREAGRGLAAAHAAGLVHRDFKPENVLIGEDGRPRVADFGLARPAGEGEAVLPDPDRGNVPEGARGARLLATPLTLTGAVLGTPAYMAPEQHAGHPSDARSDQFSFCLALYEALYGERPFAGMTVQELAASVLHGEIREAPRGSSIPTWVRRALVRGLSVEPSERFGSMAALLAALGRDARRARLRWLGMAGAVALAAAAVLISRAVQDDPSQVCAGAERRLSGIWDDGRRAAVGRALLASAKPYAAHAWRGTRRALDAYARDWAARHTTACEATRVHREHSERLLDLKMQCLDQRRQELRALVDLLAERGDRIVSRAVRAAQGLSPAAGCLDLARLMAPVPLPTDVATRTRVARLRRRLARVRALRLAGAYREALRMTAPALAMARNVGYRPLLAEALLLRGTLEGLTGRGKEAEATLYEAVADGQAARHGDVLVRAWIELADVVGYGGGRYGEGLRLAKLAQSALEGAGANEALRAQLANLLGRLHWRHGKLPEALRQHQAALDVQRRVSGSEHPQVASMLNNLALVYDDLGRFEDALRYHRKALALKTRLYSRSHPSLATTFNNLGSVFQQQGRWEEARASYERALRIRERALGPNHPIVADTLNNLGNVFYRLTDLPRAEAAYRRALRVIERRLGEHHLDAAAPLGNLASVLRDQARHQKAIHLHRRALDIYRRYKQASTAISAHELNGLGETLLAAGRFQVALATNRKALGILEQDLGLKHVDLAYPLTSIGDCLLALKRPAEGVGPLRRALALRTRARRLPALEVARTRFSLARALLAARRDRPRALKLARQARAAYRRAGKRGRQGLRRVEAWLGRYAMK